MRSGKRVGIVGAGPAGLIAIRRIRDRGLECTAFDPQGDIGGIWNYNGDVGIDEYGVEIHSSIFKNLRTNIPRDAMMIPDFPFTEGEEDTCFPRHKEVTRYMHDFADHYDLRRHIKLRHNVELVSKAVDGWHVVVKNLKDNTLETHTFDYIVVCNGHYSVPQIPDVEGMDSFKAAGGYHLHSHFYRDSKHFQGLRILVYGRGASGIDIVCELMCVAKKIIAYARTASAHERSPFPEEVIMKSQMVKLEGKMAHFADGSVEEVDLIVYATGYQYRFPFLDSSCKITVVDHKFVQQCWKHMINIHEPTMCFLGLVYDTVLFPTLDLQIRVFLSFITGDAEMPTKEELIKSWEDEVRRKKEAGIKVAAYHAIGKILEEYDDEIADAAKLERLPTKYTKIYKVIRHLIKTDYKNLRKTRFHVLNDHSFTYHNQDDPKTIHTVE